MSNHSNDAIQNISSTLKSPLYSERHRDFLITEGVLDVSLLNLVAYCAVLNIRNTDQIIKLRLTMKLLSNFFQNPTVKIENDKILYINQSLTLLMHRIKFFKKVVLERLTDQDKSLDGIMSIDVYNSSGFDEPISRISIDINDVDTLGIDIVVLNQVAEHLSNGVYSDSLYVQMTRDAISAYKHFKSMNLKTPPNGGAKV